MPEVPAGLPPPQVKANSWAERTVAEICVGSCGQRTLQLLLAGLQGTLQLALLSTEDRLLRDAQ